MYNLVNPPLHPVPSPSSEWKVVSVNQSEMARSGEGSLLTQVEVEKWIWGKDPAVCPPVLF